MYINLTLVGQLLVIHILLASVVTFVYGRRFSPSPGISILTIFAWLFPLLGPACLAIFLVARRKRDHGSVRSDLESQA